MIEYKGKKCIVTGGTGMIGHAVCAQLAEAGAQVISISLDSEAERLPGVRYYYRDLRNIHFLVPLFNGADFVFHVAGIKGSPVMTKQKPASFFVPMLTMNSVVLSAIFQARARGVYVSSIGAYAEQKSGIYSEDVDIYGAGPMDHYPGWAKRMGEMICAALDYEHKFKISIVRPSNVYGPRDNFNPDTGMVIPSLMAKTAAGMDPVPVWGRGEEIRDFVYCEDVARGILLAGLKDTQGFVNLGGDESSISDLCYNLHKITGARYAFNGEPTGTKKRVLSIVKAWNSLGWAPETRLVDGLKKTWDWFVEHGPVAGRKDFLAEKGTQHEN